MVANFSSARIPINGLFIRSVMTTPLLNTYPITFVRTAIKNKAAANKGQDCFTAFANGRSLKKQITRGMIATKVIAFSLEKSANRSQSRDRRR